MTNMHDYKITEKDIDAMVNYLRIFHPENANREYAVELFKYLKATARRMAFTEPEALNKIYDDYESSKKKSKA